MVKSFQISGSSHPHYAAREINRGLAKLKITRADIISIVYDTNIEGYVVFYWVGK